MFLTAPVVPPSITRPANDGSYRKNTGLHRSNEVLHRPDELRHRPDEVLHRSEQAYHYSDKTLHRSHESSCSTTEESRSVAELLIQLNQGKLSSRLPLDKRSYSYKVSNGWAQDTCSSSYGRNDSPHYRNNLAESILQGQSTRCPVQPVQLVQPIQLVQPVLPRSYQHNDVHYIQVPVMSVRPRIPRWRVRRADYVVYGRSTAPQQTNHSKNSYGSEPIVGDKRSAVDMLKNVPKSPNIKSKTEANSAGLKRFKPHQEDIWMEHFQQLLKFKEEKGNCLVPNTYPPNPHLARWVRRQRRQYKLLQRGLHSKMTPERFEILNKEGFVWEAHVRNERFKKYHEDKWMEHFQQLLKFKEENGNCLVPNTYLLNPLLARWVKRQRRNYKLCLEKCPESTMTPERIEILNKEGFVWDSHEVTWMRKFYDLVDYRKVHAHCRVPSLSKDQPQLASWVKFQRREYKLKSEGRSSAMTLQRIKLLNGIGFSWDARVAATNNA